MPAPRLFAALYILTFASGLLAAILVPRLLGHVDLHNLGLLAVLVGAAFAARILVLFGLIPPLEYFKLTQPISAAYKLAIAWDGLRGALTLVLAMAVTENGALDPPRQADVVALSYCRLLVLRKSDFDQFVVANPDAGRSSIVLPKRASQ